MKMRYDLAVIGAGPAGLSAAAGAASHGLSVALLDEQPGPGGQIYRCIEESGDRRRAMLGPFYQYGRGVVDRFRRADVDYLSGATVWQVTRRRKIHYLKDGKAGTVQADCLLIAAGAMERPVPLPGWTLPGVMGAGAVDVLFKSSGLVPDGSVVLAGTGPLLYVVACHLLQWNVPLKALLDTGSVTDCFRALPSLPAALPGLKYLVDGLVMRGIIMKARVPYFRDISDLTARGDQRLSRVSFRSNGTTHTLDADFLVLHDGVTPNIQITRLLGCEHAWHPVQRYWYPKLDAWGTSSVPGVFVAGDTGGVYGAGSAERAGELAALEIAHRLGAISRKERNKAAGPIHRRLWRERAARPFLDKMFPPNPLFNRPENDDTIVCRCEEITAGQVRRAALEGALGPNQVKAKLRCGMGACQGRMCGLTVSEIVSQVHHAGLDQTGYFHIRPPLKPIPLSALAEMEEDD